MENNRGTKVMALAALIVGVVGLTIGFAAFASTLTINSTATVTPENTFENNVKITDEEGTGTTLDCTTIEGTGSGTATVSGSEVTVTAALKAPGDKVTCTGKVKNESKYVAYLTSLSAAGVKSGAPEASTATQSLITAALTDITMNVTIGSDTLNDGSTVTPSGSIAAGSESDITIVIEYAEGSTNLVDGAFKVTFPVVTATYSTVK